jgi:hypothetical protein
MAPTTTVTEPPFAEVSDIEGRWRPLSSDEQARADVLLDDGSQYIRGLLGGEPGNLALAKTIVCTMVIRVLKAPVDQASLNSQQTMAGPYMETLTFASPSGDLYLTSNEKKLLGIGHGKAFSLRPAIHNCKGGEIDGW